MLWFSVRIRAGPPFRMPWVYVLCGSSGRHYIGSTTDLNRRIEQHRNGGCHSTRRLGENLELIASLEVHSLAAARELERQMKRKKNPVLALHLLDQTRRQIQRLEQPRTLSGFVLNPSGPTISIGDSQ